ncbi:ABC transporter ATP-binding protein [Candidatus Magnetomorum sp. HK-1]|nr:ABC transporter ATP-binding protein [Candidatus Magnetomorum sp. HK-1]
MLEIKNLTKYFGLKKAVNDVSFQVEKGEVLGFLGPNAAGKSTTMRMITGFIPPTSGTALIGGADITVSPIEALQKIGYLPENAPVYPEMTVRSFLEFCAEIRGFSGAIKAKKIDETIEKCFLKDVTYQPASTLSKGFKQRVCFAQSILHDPEYLVLDEPTDGLDPNQKHEVRSMIREMGINKAIILSTHILEEVDAVCTRAIIIANGHIVANDTPDQLRARSGLHGAVQLVLQNADAEKAKKHLSVIPGVKDIEILEKKDTRLSLRIFPESITVPLTDKVLKSASDNGYQIESIFTEQGRLDEVFRMITEVGEARSRLDRIVTH